MDFGDTKSKILNSFIERTSLREWKKEEHGNYSNLEIILTNVCDQRCLYCYEVKFGEKYFTEESKNPNNIRKNVKLLVKWLNENNYKPQIDLFSAELFSQQIGFDVLDILLEELPEGYKPIVIPTNMNFLFDDKKTERVEDLIEKFKKKNINMILSASVDGAFMEENRPIISGKIRDKVFYDRLFKFSKKYNIGFHPMIYSNRIEHWIKNFLWFQDNFEKYDIPFSDIYLLEVRNAEWTPKQCSEFGNFMRFLIQWLYKFFNGDAEQICNFILSRGFNILQNPFTTTSRGLGCSIQSTITVRAGDLTIVPCHRLSYEEFYGGKFIVNDDRISGIVGYNVPTYILIKSFDADTLPFCETCYVKHLCQKGCLGSQYETNKDMFTPIPTVCRLQHVKIASIIDELKKIGVLGMIFENLSQRKRDSILLLEELL